MIEATDGVVFYRVITQPSLKLFPLYRDQMETNVDLTDIARALSEGSRAGEG